MGERKIADNEPKKVKNNVEQQAIKNSHRVIKTKKISHNLQQSRTSSRRSKKSISSSNQTIEKDLDLVAENSKFNSKFDSKIDLKKNEIEVPANVTAKENEINKDLDSINHEQENSKFD